MKRNLLICFLLIFISMVNIVEATRREPLFYGQKQEVTTNSQAFLFENLMLYMQNEKYSNAVNLNLYGSVTNRTDTNWTNLVFKVNFCDKNNNVIFSDVLKVFGLNKGKLGRIVGEISDGSGNYLSSYNSYGSWYISTDQPKVLSKIKDITKVDITYIEGDPKTRVVLQMIKPENGKDLAFSDDYIDVKFSLGETDSSFGIELANRTDNPIKIDWSQVSE